MTRLEVIDSGKRESALNMAMDEALLKAAARNSVPLLRFYGWIEPAATFGYFQQYDVVAGLTSLRPLIRRPTGGGIVPHNVDWTYSLAFPAGHDWYDLKAVESYQRVHEWLRLAFADLGLETQLAPQKLVVGPGQCFSGYEQFDLLWRGRKIAGAAQRRTKEGLLIQGSVQPPAKINRGDWQASMQQAAQSSFSLEPEPCLSVSAIEQDAVMLQQTKYGREDYNRKK